MKSVLITGVGKGIGYALAQTFLERGYAVTGTFFGAKPQFTHRNFACVKLDLASPKSIRSCVRTLAQTKPKFDILINNAGALFDEKETCVVTEKLQKTLAVNLIGTIEFTERVLELLQPKSHIVNISSTAGSLELTGKNASHHPGHYPSYKISKAALNMYSRTLALRYSRTKTIVSAVHPGWVKTDMGGMEADLTPAVAAKQIVDFAITRPPTGQFWYAGKRLPW